MCCMMGHGQSFDWGFEAFIEEIDFGKDFIKRLCNSKGFTVDKGGFCGGLCCAKRARKWVLVGMNGEKEVKENLFDILKAVLDWSGEFFFLNLQFKEKFALSDNQRFFWDNGLGKLVALFFGRPVSLLLNTATGEWKFYRKRKL